MNLRLQLVVLTAVLVYGVGMYFVGYYRGKEVQRSENWDDATRLLIRHYIEKPETK